MNVSLLIWLVPTFFIIHDFEEIIVMEEWLIRNEKDLLTVVPKQFHAYFYKMFPKKTSGFALAVLVEYIGILACTCLSIFNPDQEWPNIGILAVVSILFLHSFTHIGQLVVLRRYTPGVVTAILLLIPFSLYFYIFLLNHGVIQWDMIWVSIPVGIVMAAVLNQLGLWLGKKISS